MKPLSLAIGVGLCTLTAMAQPWGATYTLPSRMYLPGASDDTISFATPILLDPMSATYPYFGNVTYSYFIDTNFVDMEFAKSGGTFHVSDAINSTIATYSLSSHGYIMGAPEMGGQGTAAGTITRQGAVGTTLFEVTIGWAEGAEILFRSPMANVIVNGDGTFLRFVVHPQAIAGLPNQSYQIAPNTKKSIIRNGTSPTGVGNGPLVLVGGSFTAVPEPATIAAIGGAMFLVTVRRRREATT